MSYSERFISASNMTAASILLPLLLKEPAPKTLSGGRGKKKAYYKPFFAESMTRFIDIQKVDIR